MENKFVLYIHCRNTDNIIFYVGIGVCERPRSKRDRNPHWKRTVKKHGYHIKILKENLYWSEACELEKYMIQFYGRKDKKLGTLVNQTDGGDGFSGGTPWNKGICLPDEIRKKVSDTLKGKYTGELNPFFGKQHSDETKIKMKKAVKTRPKISEETRMKMSAAHKGRAYTKGKKLSNQHKMSISRKLGKKCIIDNVCYWSVREASVVLDIPHETIKQRISSKYFTNYNYIQTN